MRGRPPKPTHLKLVRGNPGKRKLNTDEPRPTPTLPTMPDHLDAEARAEWARAGAELAAIGILSILDRAVLAGYCVAWSTFVQATQTIQLMRDKDDVGKGLVMMTKNENMIQNPLVGIANVAARDVLRFAEQLGMTPSARARLNAVRQSPGDDGAAHFFGDDA